MRILFLATSEFALPAFQALLEHPELFEICLVVTRPPAPAGRGLKPQPSPISQAASQNGLRVTHPLTLSGSEYDQLLAEIAVLEPDFAVVASYGLLLTEALIATPRLATVNIHASLLPRWRGAAPIERAILAGDATTGVTLQQLRLALDSGPIYSQTSITIGAKPFSQLFAEMAAAGAALLTRDLPLIASGQLLPVEQDESQATYADKLTQAELALSCELDSAANLRRIQAAGVRTPARALVAGRGVRVLAAQAVQGEVVAVLDDMRGGGTGGAAGEGTAKSGISGTVLLVNRQLFLSTADGWLCVDELAPDGKRPMSGQAFASGIPELRNTRRSTWQTWPGQSD